MKIVKTDTYRSGGKGVNMTDDMVRVVLDMTWYEWAQFRKENGLPKNKWNLEIRKV